MALAAHHLDRVSAGHVSIEPPIGRFPPRSRQASVFGTTQVTFGLLAFALGSILSGSTAFLLVFHGVNIEAFKIPFGAYLMLVNLIFLGPLLVFVPLLARTRRQGLREFSSLAGVYNNSFADKWIRCKSPEGEPLLGSSDIQSLADMGNSFQFARQMKLFPFSLQESSGCPSSPQHPCFPCFRW